MAPRRKAPRRRAKKSFNISAIEAGTALSLAQSTGASSAVDSMLQAGAAVAKALSKGFMSGTLAKLGPIRVKL
jgi:hypothetical protein